MEATFSSCKRETIEGFVEKHHYSHNLNGVIADYCFKLTDGDRLVGAAVFGRLAMASQWKRYGEHEEEVLELRRLVCVDEAPKNTESWFIAKCLKWLRDYTEVKAVVSYADPEYGHSGTIYKASNFEYKGLSSPGKVIMWNGEKYHDKAIRTKYRGRLKPFAQELKNALETGDAAYKPTQGKHTYVYKIRRSHNMRRHQPSFI